MKRLVTRFLPFLFAHVLLTGCGTDWREQHLEMVHDFNRLLDFQERAIQFELDLITEDIEEGRGESSINFRLQRLLDEVMTLDFKMEVYNDIFYREVEIEEYGEVLQLNLAIIDFSSFLHGFRSMARWDLRHHGKEDLLERIPKFRERLLKEINNLRKMSALYEVRFRDYFGSP